VIIRRLIAPLTAAVFAFHALEARAQSAFPAPLPGAPAAPRSDSAFPPVNGAAPSPVFGGAPSAFPSNGAPPVGGFSQPGAPQAAAPNDDCMNRFGPLRQEAEKRRGLIQTAGERRVSADDACKLFVNYSQSEIKMIKYIEANTQKCNIPPEVGEQMKAGHKNTETMMKKVCDAAKQQQARGPAGPSLSDVLGSSSALPEATVAKKNGGTTFDTLNGNVLSR
jgi:hypothetical protein